MSQAVKEFAVRVLLIFISCVVYNVAVSVQACLAEASWCSGTYVYDGMGNIRAIGADTYIYDTAGRLVSGTADVNRTGMLSRQDYSYDAFGNRTGASPVPGSVNCLGGCEQSLTIDPATNHITSNGAQYDDAGNLISITNTVNGTSFTSTYDYDALGNMIRASAGSDVRQFIYTADGERIATRNGQNWTWTVRGLDGHVLRAFTSTEPNNSPGLPANMQWAKDYIWRDGLLLATVEPTTPGANTRITKHFHLDHLGTPRVVTNDGGVQIGLHAYYPFGAELNLGLSEQPGELMKFTGHERDLLASNPNTLDYMHARYYSPVEGRFLGPDPVLDLKGTLPNPQLWNRYSYVQNNPIRYTDPDGKAERDLQCDVCTTPEMQTAFRQGQTDGIKWGLAIDAAIIGGIELPGAARALFSWVLGNPYTARQIVDAVAAPPGYSSPSLTQFERQTVQLANKLQFTATTLEHMKEAERMVPRSTLAQAVLTGARSADPQGAPGAIQITQNMTRAGKDYVLRIIYREKDHMILHFEYATAK